MLRRGLSTLTGHCIRLFRETKSETDHYETQFVTGHYNFKIKLKKFNMVDNADCSSCMTEEAAEHMLMEECKDYEEEEDEDL